MIHVENLSKVFRTEEIETVALNNVSFDTPSSTSSASSTTPPRAATNSWARK